MTRKRYQAEEKKKQKSREKLTPQRNRHVRHHRLTAPTMPVRLPGGDMHDIAHPEPLRRLALGANEARPHRHGENLHCPHISKTPHPFRTRVGGSVTCPRSWVCQNVLAPGVKHTLLPMQSSAEKMGSMCTVPEKVSVG